MSLTLQLTTTPIVYRGCTPEQFADPGIYQPQLCTLPRIFNEEFASLRGFFYDAQNDVYRVLAILNATEFPGNHTNYYSLSAQTGLTTATTFDITTTISLFLLSNWSAGAFKKVYANRVGGTIVDIDVNTGLASSLTPIVEQSDVPTASLASFVLNRNQTIIANNGSNTLTRFNYDTGAELTPVAMPFVTILDTAYESDELCWCLQRTSDNTRFVIVKVNYLTGKVEGYTILDEPATPDINAGIAYDTLRKSVAVFRHKPPNADGSAAHELQIFKPIAAPTLLTDPVPVTRVIIEQPATLIAHLIGSVGEGGGGKKVTITNSGSGSIQQTVIGVKANGSIPILYNAPPTTGVDTVTVTADV